MSSSLSFRHITSLCSSYSFSTLPAAESKVTLWYIGNYEYRSVSSCMGKVKYRCSFDVSKTFYSAFLSVIRYLISLKVKKKKKTLDFYWQIINKNAIEMNIWINGKNIIILCWLYINATKPQIFWCFWFKFNHYFKMLFYCFLLCCQFTKNKFIKWIQFVLHLIFFYLSCTWTISQT